MTLPLDDDLDPIGWTHFVRGDDPAPPRTVVHAICGAFIRRSEAVGQPTCPKCRQLLAEVEPDGQ